MKKKYLNTFVLFFIISTQLVAQTLELGIWGGNKKFITKPVKAIAAGKNHAVALQEDGTVVQWGGFTYNEKLMPEDLAGVRVIAAGCDHTIAIKEDSTVVAWGKNSSNQCNVPPGLNNVVAVSAGDFHSVALKSDGTVVAWGGNDYGELNIPTGLDSIINIACTVNGIFALKSNGKLEGWGYRTYVNPFLTNIKLLVAGGNNYVVQQSDGSIIDGGFFSVPDAMKKLKKISASESHRIGIRNDNTLAIYGSSSNSFNELSIPDGITTVKDVAAGYYFSLVLLTDGTVVCWGTNDYGQLNIPKPIRGLNRIAVGAYHFLALKSDGTVHAFGYNNSGQTNVPKNLNSVIDICAGLSHSVALKKDSTVVVWGSSSDGEQKIPAGLKKVVDISSGPDYIMALKDDGTIVSWGYSGWNGHRVPSGLTDVKAISAGNEFSLALKNDGTIIGWGRDYSGQITIPVGLKNVRAIAAGGFHSVAIKEDSTVVCWGLNSSGQCKVPAGLKNVVAIAAGYYHTIALKSDGTMVAWGLNDWKQAKQVEYNNIAEIAAGLNFTMVRFNNPNEKPTISISNKVLESPAPAKIILNTQVADLDGHVVKVDFYIEDKLVSVDSISPFNYQLENLEVGIYKFIAVAWDNKGDSSVSSPVSFRVNPNKLPVVRFTNNKLQFIALANISLAVAASDTDGVVSSVEFLHADTLLAKDITEPFNFSWNNLRAGTYRVQAKATDSNGGVSYSSIVSFEVVPNQLPFTKITNTNVEFQIPSAVNLTASAIDPDGSVVNVEFYADETFLGRDEYAPYTFSWAKMQPGIYKVTSRVTDDKNARVSSDTIVFVIRPNLLPAIEITNTTLSYIAPANINLTVNVTDPEEAVLKVEFFNGTKPLGTDAFAPFMFDWKNVQTGNYTITAKVTDNASNFTISQPVIFNVYASADCNGTPGGAALLDKCEICTGGNTGLVPCEITSMVDVANSPVNSFPNPFLAIIRLESVEEFSYIIYNVMGQVVETANCSGNCEAAGNLVSGLYTLETKNNGGRKVSQIVKQ